MAFITLDMAMAHLRVTFPLTSPADARETDLRLKMLQAEEIVLDYLKYTATSPAIWTDETDVPPLVQAAILLQLGELYRFRGDEADGHGPAQTPGDLSPHVTNLLRRYRDPALA